LEALHGEQRLARDEVRRLGRLGRHDAHEDRLGGRQHRVVHLRHRGRDGQRIGAGGDARPRGRHLSGLVIDRALCLGHRVHDDGPGGDVVPRLAAGIDEHPQEADEQGGRLNTNTT
jgi:hypothetical protein